MANSDNTKLRLLVLKRILEEQTDAEHPMTLPQIAAELEASGCPAERRALYSDLEALRLSGMDIEHNAGKTHTYYLASRTFELPELKLLVDTVQASHLVTTRKTMKLIAKLGTLASRYEATQLRRQVYVKDRVKNMNESIYYSIDKLHTAIADRRKVAFQYTEYAPDKTLRLRHDGAFYHVSPYMLTYDMNNYYLVAHFEGRPGLSHYRVDRMTRVSVLEAAAEPPEEGLDPARYAERVFSMNVGEERLVRVRFANRLATVVIDRFGKDVRITDLADDCFTAAVRVSVSGAFLTWVFQFGDEARIIAPDDVVDEARRLITSLAATYKM